ncbi:hypothetical protein SO802_012384 [Lithocarpus litseifolius]|uniref:Proteasomal ATPase second OB domain-containing protein n=1 Tax=Lithocarpus litseifolius TaxID=425828 RepID=A0AAW2D550_9ROSI
MLCISWSGVIAFNGVVKQCLVICLHSMRYVCLLSRYPVGTKDHKDITDVLKVVQEIGRVQPPNPEAPNEEAATLAAAATQRPSTTESPSTSTAPTVPSPTSHPPPSPTIPSPIPHPSPSPTIPPPTPYPCPSRSHPPIVRLLALLRALTHPMFRLSRLLGYLQLRKVGQNAYQRHLLVGQGGTNMDTKLGPRHLTKDMQNLLLIIRDSVKFKKGPTNENLVTNWFMHFRWDSRCTLGLLIDYELDTEKTQKKWLCWMIGCVRNVGAYAIAVSTYWKALCGALVDCLALMRRKSNSGVVTSIDAKIDAQSFLQNLQSINREKIKLNKQLPYLVGNIVEILEMNPEDEAEEDGANIDLDSQEGKMCCVETSTRLIIFLPVVGLVDPDKLKPGDLVGVNKDSYLILDTLPSEYDSRVKAMEVDEKPTEDYNDIGGLEK